MSTSQQVLFVVKKNLLISFRNKEFFVESLLPIVVAGMLSLKGQYGKIFLGQLQALQQLMPLLYSLALTSTYRSILIKLVEEKSKRYKELQKIMGMKEKSYTIGWILTGYIRIGMAVVVFELSWFVFNVAFDVNWDEEFHESFWQLLWPYVLFSYTVIFILMKAMNQIFLFASLFNEVKIAGEMQSFIQIAFNFFIYFCFAKKAANKVIFYILMGAISPQCCIAFSYISAMNSSQGKDLTKLNLFPTDIISETYPTEFAGYQLAIQFVIYFLLFLYFDQIMPNEYGIAKHPLFFLNFKHKHNKVGSKDLFLKVNQSDSEISSAMYNEEIKNQAPPSIIINNLLKKFGTLNAVDNISFSLYESQIFCLLGHNGAGKTTAINLLTGMIQKTSGLVKMYDMNLDTQLPEIRQSLGLCTQKDCLYEDLTVIEHLEFISGIKGRFDRQEMIEILEKTELLEEQHKQVQTLSGGSKRKLSLAMSLVGNSKIIFLDEPTSGMDAYSRRSIWKILEKIREDQRTIILTTHHLDEAEVLADRIGIMSRGQLLAVGSSNFIKKRFGEGYNLKISFNNCNLKNKISEIVNEKIQDCLLETQHSNENQLVFNIPFSCSNKLGDLFFDLEKIDVKIGLEMKTLEDAFVKIGLEDDKFHLNYLRKSEIQVARQSLGLTKEDEGDGASLMDKETENRPVVEEVYANESDGVQSIPSCLTKDPIYNFSSQVLAIFLRRYYTVIRTSTNYFSIMVPMITFIIGMSTVAGVDFETLIAEIFPQMDPESLKEATEFFKLSLLTSLCVLAFCFNSTVYITQPVLEKETYLKQALIGMGCRTLPYWLGTFCFDYLIYLCFIVIFYTISATLNLEIAFKYFWSGFSCFILFGFSYILYAYLIGFLFKTLESALKLYAMFCFFVSFSIPFISIACVDFFYQKFDNNEIIKIVIYVLQFFYLMVTPFFTFFDAFIFLADNFEKLYQLKFYNTPQLIQRTQYFQIILLAQIIGQITLLYIIESRGFQFSLLSRQNIKKQEFAEEVEIEEERKRIENNDQQDPIICKNLEKEYIKDKPTLKQLTFGVKKGEIFAIIGPNGAGKSTLINVFTGINTPTAGLALINGAEPKERNMQIMQHVGICPQFDCIWDGLTPIEHLLLFGRIKGLQGHELEQAVNYFIKTMQLDLFVKTKAGQLSGGNKRKLCVADALIGGSDITFFDEPSTGVDPISRRFLFNTLQRNIQLRNCSAIMTTHTIDEAENLSQRIGILIAGQFKCLGSSQYLRQKYGTGYQIQIKMSMNLQESDIEIVANSILEYFPNSQRLDDKRKGFMTLSMPSAGFSFYRTFQYFQGILNDGTIEDFQINESSLEQIFIHFSRIQQQINEQEGVVFD